MKKSTRKLNLVRVTVRQLVGEELREANGGATTDCSSLQPPQSVNKPCTGLRTGCKDPTQTTGP